MVTATFLTEDSYLGNINEPLTLNRYNYCVSSYLNYRDPSGNIVTPIGVKWIEIILDWITGNDKSEFTFIEGEPIPPTSTTAPNTTPNVPSIPMENGEIKGGIAAILDGKWEGFEELVDMPPSTSIDEIVEKVLAHRYTRYQCEIEQLHVSSYMIELLKMHEEQGVAALKVYIDANGYETIAFGHKLESADEKYSLKDGTVIDLYTNKITEEIAEEIFANDIAEVESIIKERLKSLQHTVTQREFDALISLVFNVGEYASITPVSDTETKKTSYAADTLEWFINEEYRNKEYTLAILGDMTSGDLGGIKKRRLDEIDVLFLESESLTEIYKYNEDIERYGDIWHKIPEQYKAKTYITVPK